MLLVVVYQGWTALHYACSSKALEVAELLISHGADTAIYDKVAVSAERTS